MAIGQYQSVKRKSWQVDRRRDDGNGYLIAQAKGADIVEVALSFGVKLESESGNREFSGACLRCGGTDCLHVSRATNGWFCRKCNGLERHGWKDAIEFVTYYGRVDFRTAVERLTGRQMEGKSPVQKNITAPASVESSLSPVEGSKIDDSDKFDPTYWVPRYGRSVALLADSGTVDRWEDGRIVRDAGRVGIGGEDGREYLKMRGFERKTWERFGFGFDPAVAVPGTDGQQRAPAIVMPWFGGGQLRALRYRFLSAQQRPTGKTVKQTGRGSPKGLFFGGLGLEGFQAFQTDKPTERLRCLFVCEGEMNAMSIWQAAHPARVDVVSIGSQDSKLTAPMLDFVARYGDVIAWLDQPDRSANVVSAIRERVPHVLGIASPKDNDANDWLKLGKLQYIVAWLRLERAAGGDVDAIQRIIYDYLDAVDAGEMTLSGETMEILRKFGAKIGVGI